MVSTSLKSPRAVYENTGLLGGDPSVENFALVLNRTSFGRQMINSLIYASAVIAVCILLASLAGYAFSRYRGAVFSFCQLLLLLVLMFPLVLLLIPLYMTLNVVDLINSPVSILLAYLAFQLPFSIWMLKGFFSSIPIELEEASLLDGCTRVQTLFRIVLPLSLPGVATVSIFTFIRVWNEFMMASVLVPESDVTTISVGLRKFIQQTEVAWGRLLAGATVATIPAALFILLAQRYLVQGLTSGAVKG
jgi:ABC-type glycerol-3-phosphate transport system permease component